MGTFNFGEVILQALQNQENKKLEEQRLYEQQRQFDKQLLQSDTQHKETMAYNRERATAQDKYNQDTLAETKRQAIQNQRQHIADNLVVLNGTVQDKYKPFVQSGSDVEKTTGVDVYDSIGEGKNYIPLNIWNQIQENDRSEANNAAAAAMNRERIAAENSTQEAYYKFDDNNRIIGIYYTTRGADKGWMNNPKLNQGVHYVKADTISNPVFANLSRKQYNPSEVNSLEKRVLAAQALENRANNGWNNPFNYYANNGSDVIKLWRKDKDKGQGLIDILLNGKITQNDLSEYQKTIRDLRNYQNNYQQQVDPNIHYGLMKNPLSGF